MVKSHRLPEPRLAAFRPVDFRGGFAGGRTLACAPLACADGFARRFFVVLPVRLRPVSLLARPPDLPAPLRLRAAPVTVSELTTLLKLLFGPPRGGVVINESEFFSIEFFEEFFPRDFLERTGAAVARKIDPQNSGIIPLPRVLFTTAGRPPRASTH